MGRTALFERNKKRQLKAAMYKDKRVALVASLRSVTTAPEERLLAYKKLSKMPRDAFPTRIRNLCKLTWRSRAVYRDFGLSRIMLRHHALNANVPGVVKGSL